MHEFKLPLFAKEKFKTTMPQSEFPKTAASNLLDYSIKGNCTKPLPKDFVAMDKKMPDLDTPIDIFVVSKKQVKPYYNNPWTLVEKKNQLFSDLDITFQNVDRPTSTINMKSPKPGKYFWRPAEVKEENHYRLKKNNEFYYLPATTPA